MRIVLVAAAAVSLAGCAWFGQNGSYTETTNTDTTTTTTATTDTASGSMGVMGTTGSTGATAMGPVTDEQRRASVDELNEATRMLIDSSKLYGDAAKLAKDPDVKAELTTLSKDRGNQVTQFQNQVRSLGGDPVTKGGVGGTWQEGLMKTKSLVTKDTKAAVDQVLASENGLIDKLNDDIGDAKLDEGTRSFLRQARDANQRDRDRITQLKAKVDQAR